MRKNSIYFDMPNKNDWQLLIKKCIKKCRYFGPLMAIVRDYEQAGTYQGVPDNLFEELKSKKGR